ncbi:hypothetical protein IGK73_000772 [Enterococcus sp. AZ102]
MQQVLVRQAYHKHNLSHKYAKPIAESNDLYTSVMMAQAIIESNWGNSALSQAPNYNLFGIKGSYNGQTVSMNTQEYLNNQWVTKKEPFKRYPSYRESFLDNAATLRGVSFSPGVYYYAGAFKSNTTSYRDATAWLTGRYATAPHYAQALNQIIETYQLTQYDSGGPTKPVDYQPNKPIPESSTSSNIYTVVSGDYLSKIANQFGVSVTQIKAWNNLSSDLILVGQKLTVKAPSTPAPVTPTPSTPPTSENTSTYTVVSGDYLGKIAARFGISVAQLKSWNNLNTDLILVGQNLIVKAPSTPAPVTPTPLTPSTSENTSTYTVISGDYLSKIANQFGVSVTQIKAWNKLSSDLILVGQKLTVKAPSTSSTPTTPTPSTPPTSENTSTYTVVSGDYLGKIAARFGISVAQLKSWNNLNTDLILVGQKLTVKAPSTSSPSTPVQNQTASPAPSTPVSTKTYKVVSGDNLWTIASRNQTSVQALKQLNQLTSDTIFIGQILKLK